MEIGISFTSLSTCMCGHYVKISMNSCDCNYMDLCMANTGAVMRLRSVSKIIQEKAGKNLCIL